MAQDSTNSVNEVMAENQPQSDDNSLCAQKLWADMRLPHARCVGKRAEGSNSQTTPKIGASQKAQQTQATPCQQGSSRGQGGLLFFCNA